MSIEYGNRDSIVIFVGIALIGQLSDGSGWIL